MKVKARTKVERHGLYRPWNLAALALMLAVALFLASCGGEEGGDQQEGGGGEGGGAEETTQEQAGGEMAGGEQGVSMYQIAENPQEYYGSTVTVTGEVSNVLGSNAMLVVPQAGVSGADDMLVISPVPLSEASEATEQSGDAPLSQGETVQITGEVREFELLAIEQEIGVDLDDESLDAYDGTPSIIASSISLEPPVPEEG